MVSVAISRDQTRRNLRNASNCFVLGDAPKSLEKCHLAPVCGEAENAPIFLVHANERKQLLVYRTLQPRVGHFDV
jgi:hypothetical protein